MIKINDYFGSLVKILIDNSYNIKNINDSKINFKPHDIDALVTIESIYTKIFRYKIKKFFHLKNTLEDEINNLYYHLNKYNGNYLDSYPFMFILRVGSNIKIRLDINEYNMHEFLDKNKLKNFYLNEPLLYGIFLISFLLTWEKVKSINYIPTFMIHPNIDIIVDNTYTNHFIKFFLKNPANKEYQQHNLVILNYIIDIIYHNNDLHNYFNPYILGTYNEEYGHTIFTNVLSSLDEERSIKYKELSMKYHLTEY